MSSRSLRGMPELGKVVESAENDDEQGDHRDESRMVAGEGLAEGDESGDEQRGGGAGAR